MAGRALIIEKGIPVPIAKAYEPRTKLGRLVVAMEPGDSILFDTQDEMFSARHVMKVMKWRYKSRKVIGGWRIWRIDIEKVKDVDAGNGEG